ncbi:lytic polysaccharide monooxygenase [Karstenula rhodostoma CBS 690.94]|uniref:lytic cellulose monooxygenase (C4-dehydrogenating) n=1 Tax=Karstenula rhodostoma CBS 690.94 TaxID=1392251 RepID=A0A9P4U6U0_9PLEO|nr:lytic polysaccharide monooxygenase [Karstenula rhodostoma CBS 690.94]
MKLTTALSVAAATSSVHGAALQPRHYTFPSIGSSSAWQYVRQTDNYQSNGPVTDVSSNLVRCYTSSNRGAAATQSVAAGSSVTFKANQAVFHQGPIQFYMAKVPSGQTAATWDGSGQVWFKIYTEKPASSSSGLSWASLNQASFSVTIPKNVPSGEYLLRIEHIALHGASAVNGAQLYISCAQLSVTGGGSGSPGPLVAFPGAYKNTDPGLQVNIYSAKSYSTPGPAVWSG